MQEFFNAYLNYIGLELKRMEADVKDVEEFVIMHMNSTRNKILKLSLFMEMGMLSVAFGAMLAGLWGMNMVPKAWQFEEAYKGASGEVTPCTIFILHSSRLVPSPSSSSNTRSLGREQ